MKFIIYNNNLNFGGAEVCFIDICKVLRESGCDVVVMCEKNNERFISKLKKINGVEIFDFLNYSCKYNDYFHIFNGQTLRDFENKYESKELRKLVWIMHPDELGAYICKGYYKIKERFGVFFARLFFYGTFLFNRRSIKRVKNMFERGEIVFMDGATYWTSMQFINRGIFDMKNANIIPVISDFGGKVFFENIDFKNKKIKNIFYFGRVEDFKFNAIMGLLNDLSLQKELSLHIIGDGKDLKKIENYAKKNSLDVNFYGFMDRLDAIKLMHEKADLVFAMGIAALDCVSSGIPVAILNPFTKINTSKKYNFLFEESYYGVGDFLDDEFSRKNKIYLKSFVEIKEDCEKNRKYIVENNFLHVSKFHSRFELKKAIDKYIFNIGDE